MSGVAFVDTETIGLDPERHPIWEIAVIVDGVEHCWQQRLTAREWTLADPCASKLTRFYERYNPNEALIVQDSLTKLSDLIMGRHWVGAIPSFDEERVRRAWNLHMGPSPERWPWHYHLIDVEAMAVGYLSAKVFGWHGRRALNLPWNSEALSTELGIEPPQGDDRHTALADARWAKAIYERIVGA